MATLDPSSDILPAETAAGQARAAALATYSAPQPAIDWVEYQSHGRLLIIGPAEQAWPLAKALAAQLDCVVLATQRPAADATLRSTAITSYGRVHRLHGYLGAFELQLETDAGVMASGADMFGAAHAQHDLVLDLEEKPAIASEVAPPGYYHASDAAARERALQELPDMIGVFQKPRYVNYDADICAHGERGLGGCRNCLDVCAADAPIDMGERIAINFNLCQGCGSCTVVCPTGALTYALPPVGDQLDALRRLLAAYRAAGGTTPVLAFHGEDYDGAALRALPEHVLPIEVEDVGSLGMEAWFTLLAYGAHQIRLLAHADMPPTLVNASRSQIELVAPILTALDDADAERRVCLDMTADAAADPATPPALVDVPATFAALGDKREVFQRALAHVHPQRPDAAAQTVMPPQSPFGAVQVDDQACTLCMACVSVCPAAALQGGGNKPQLWFNEDHCVQCGLCDVACPEDAITLHPQLDVAAHVQPQKRLLNEERMQLCLDCGKPFATRKMVERMQSKLSGHWMFQTAQAQQVLLLCEDCRIARTFADDSAIHPHRD